MDDANLAGNQDKLVRNLNAFGRLTPAEEAMFQQLLDSGAVFTPALQWRASRAVNPAEAGSQCRPAVEDVVEFWLEARQTLGGDGPLAERFCKLRALHSLLPELRGEPHVGNFSEVELRQLWERVTGECGGERALYSRVPCDCCVVCCVLFVCQASRSKQWLLSLPALTALKTGMATLEPVEGTGATAGIQLLSLTTTPHLNLTRFGRSRVSRLQWTRMPMSATLI